MKAALAATAFNSIPDNHYCRPHAGVGLIKNRFIGVDFYSCHLLIILMFMHNFNSQDSNFIECSVIGVYLIPF